MDSFNKLIGGESRDQPKKQQEEKSGGFMDRFNAMVSGDESKGEPKKQPEEKGGFMDKLSAMTAGGESKDQSKKQKDEQSGGFMGKLNSMAGGGKESEKNEDALDKAVDWVQEHVLGQGDQSNESAVEQAKDERISDFIRDQYKKTTGSDLPIKDKPRF